MIDDIESKVMNTEAYNTSNKFNLRSFDLDEEQGKETIISMSSSKKNIFFLTENHNLFLADSVTLKTINELYSLPEPKESIEFKEKGFNKIWCDREGNHCIIRHNNSIYYFNNATRQVVELEKFRKIEICAVALDDKNTEYNTTKNFLAVDYDNKIYECCVEIIPNKKEKIKERIEELTTLNFLDPNNDDDEDTENRKSYKPIKDRIYGLKFIHSINSNVDQEKDNCYIIAVSKNQLYQFIGPGLKSFKQIFSRYDRNPSLLYDGCRYFPKGKKEFKVEFNILYKTYNKSQIFSQFGWRTDTGYCLSDFSYENNYKDGGLPCNLNNFTIIPFEKITNKGKKEINLNPISVTQSFNHVFFLYEDCITVISKLSSNIIHTEYINIKYDQMIFHEFSKDNGIILLSSKSGLYQMSLKNENVDIWKDYLDLGDYQSAISLCKSEKLKEKIGRINAEEEFNKKLKKNRAEAAQLYAYSDEKFENVCLKYLMEKDLDGLRLYLECYKSKNLNVGDNEEEKKEKALQLNLINTWMIEIMLNKQEVDIKDFRGAIRENKKFICPELIYQTLLNYGKSKEYLAFASIFGDFERATIYHLNQGQIQDAVELLREFASFDDLDILKVLLNIFIDNCHLFFQEDPSGSIDLLNTFLNNNIEISKNIMESVIQALMSRTDKDNIKTKKKEELIEGKKAKIRENIRTILLYLKSLMEGQNKSIKTKIKDQMNNIHNLYIYYLSINPGNKTAVVEYLKKYLELDQRGKRKLKVLFQLDYAKRLLKDNKLAYSLVLALMGKYSEGVYYALKKDPKYPDEDTEYNKEIAEYIANSATDNKLKKKLWIEIFRNYSESGGDSQDPKKEKKFTQAMEVMQKSQILKIEDVLPHITDSIKIEEFQKEISDCINQYEKNINGLKRNIQTYNNIAENIKKDINKIKKRSMEVKYNEFKCDICKSYIKNKNIFLFPCGHMFDMDCIRECLLNYEVTGLDYLHDDNLFIDKISFQLGYIKQRVFTETNTINVKEEPKKTDEKKNKKTKEPEIKKEEMQKISLEGSKEYKELLNSYLSRQCVLCGDFLVDSVQCSLNPRKKMVDSYGFKLALPEEPDFMF